LASTHAQLAFEHIPGFVVLMVNMKSCNEAWRANRPIVIFPFRDDKVRGNRSQNPSRFSTSHTLRKSAWIRAKDFPKDFYSEIESFARGEMPIFDSRREAVAWLVQD